MSRRTNYSIQISLQRIPKADTFGHADPYCKIFYNGTQMHKTETIPNTKNAKFKDFVLTVYDSSDEITIKMFDEDDHGKHDYWGSSEQ